MPSLLISDAEFQMLPEEVRSVLIARFIPGGDNVPDAVGRPAVSEDADGEELPDLSPAQARKFLAACSDRTKDVIREIVNFPVSGFPLPGLEQKVGVEPGQLKGSWTGITKVCRRILGDDEAMLILWTECEDGAWRGRISPMTHQSFRKALGMS